VRLRASVNHECAPDSRSSAGIAAGWSDYTLETSIFNYDNAYVGVVFRFVDRENHYIFLWHGNPSLNYQRRV
jgi:hypothetical protein